MTVVQTILDQLGGNKFIAMTGSKHFTDCGNTLKMTLAGNASKANRLDVTLNASDTYDMAFYRYTPVKVCRKTFEVKNEQFIEVAKFDGIYCDQLQSLFTEVTGLYTRL